MYALVLNPDLARHACVAWLPLPRQPPAQLACHSTQHRVLIQALICLCSVVAPSILLYLSMTSGLSVFNIIVFNISVVIVRFSFSILT